MFMFDSTYKKIGLALALSLTVYLIIRYIGALTTLVLPLLLALLISYKMHPIIKHLDDHSPLPRGIISLLSVLLAIGFITIAGFLLLQFILFSVTQLAAILPQATSELDAFYKTALTSYHSYFNLIPDNWQGLVTNSIDSLIRQLGTFAASLATNVVNGLTFLPNIVFFLVFTLLTTYFVTRDFEKVDSIIHQLMSFLNSKILYHEVRSNIFTVIIGYLKAQLILMSITFVISFIGLTILRIKYAPLIAIIIALIDALPMFGPAIVYTPWIIARILVANYSGALALGILYLIATLTRQMLEPKIVSTQIGVHPIITLSSMYAGIKLFGVFGIILGPLSAITIIKSYKILTSSQKHEH